MKGFTNTVMMIRPANFGFNSQTAENNAFQVDSVEDDSTIAKRAQKEFDSFVDILRSAGINVIEISDTETPVKPDAVFPNNWISLHQDGSIITYPMFAENRRIERRMDIVEELKGKVGYTSHYSFEVYEDEGIFLEGTGSMVLDRENRICYACLSPRTDITLLDKFCILKGYKLIHFYAFDQEGVEIYHTNVMMALGHDFAVVCMDSIEDNDYRELFIQALKESNKDILDITFDQMNAFAGNMLQLETVSGEEVLVMSTQAYNSLNEEQLSFLRNRTQIVHANLDTIESIGGGSARCMLAEVFEPL